MPDTSTFSGLPVPLYSEDADLPVALGDFRSSLEPRIVLQAESVADMQDRYGATPPGTIVSVPSTPAVYQKTPAGANSWRVISEDTGWQTFPGSIWKPNWANVSSGWRRVNGFTMVDIGATYTGPQVDAPSSGNIPDIDVLTLPSNVAPVHQRVPTNFLASSPGTMLAYVNGLVSITHIYSNGALNNNTTLTASFIYARGESDL